MEDENWNFDEELDDAALNEAYDELFHPSTEKQRNMLKFFGPTWYAEIHEREKKREKEEKRERELDDLEIQWAQSVEDEYDQILREREREKERQEERRKEPVEDEISDAPLSKKPRMSDEELDVAALHEAYDEFEQEEKRRKESVEEQLSEAPLPKKPRMSDEEFHHILNTLWDELALPPPEHVEPLSAPLPPPIADPFQLDQSGAGNPADTFEIKNVFHRASDRFHTSTKEYKVRAKVEPREESREAVESTLSILFDIVDHVKDDVPSSSPSDQIRLIVDSPALDYALQLPFMPLQELTPQRVVRHLEGIAQSKKDFFLQGEFDVTVLHVKNMEGQGRHRDFNERKYEKTQAWLEGLAKRKSIVLCPSLTHAAVRFLHDRDNSIPYNDQQVKQFEEELPIQGADSF